MLACDGGGNQGWRLTGNSLEWIRKTNVADRLALPAPPVGQTSALRGRQKRKFRLRRTGT